jgi:hypothetical protein
MKMSDVLKSDRLLKLIGIFFLLAMGLFWLGYRVQGIPCTYKPEALDVIPLVPVTEHQRFFMRAIPFLLLLTLLGLAWALII